MRTVIEKNQAVYQLGQDVGRRHCLRVFGGVLSDLADRPRRDGEQGVVMGLLQDLGQ